MEKQQMILAVDPGTTESGYAVIMMPEFTLCEFGKVANEEMLEILEKYSRSNAVDAFAVEMVASYGMSVGKHVFETCVWIGRFVQAIHPKKAKFVYRKDEKLCLCGNITAKDSNIRQALIDRYAKHDFKSGKGVKKNPDTFYGVSKDAWQAIAVGVTFHENQLLN